MTHVGWETVTVKQNQGYVKEAVNDNNNNNDDGDDDNIDADDVVRATGDCVVCNINHLLVCLFGNITMLP